MITPSFGLTATERVLPKLALDFTTAALDSRITFTRTPGAATYVGSNGYITSATNNQPRFDYDPITLVCKGLLIEESRTNAFSYSNTFTDASWTKTNLTPTVSNVTSPDGTLNAWTFTGTGVITNTNIFRSISNANTYTMSFYVRAKSVSTFNMQASSAGNGRLCSYDLSAQTVSASSLVGTGGTVSAASGAITPAGNSWYRCTFTYTQSGTNFVFLLMPAGTLDVAFAQHEIGAFATSYIPTVASQVTRSADVATMTGTNFSSWYNATEGTFVATSNYGGVVASSICNLYAASDGTVSNRIQQFFTNSMVGNRCVSATSSAAPNNNTATFPGLHTAALTFKLGTNMVAASTNASVINVGTNTATSTALPVVDRLYIGSRYDGTTEFLNSTIQKLRFYAQRLTNAEVRAFSKG